MLKENAVTSLRRESVLRAGLTVWGAPNLGSLIASLSLASRPPISMCSATSSPVITCSCTLAITTQSEGFTWKNPRWTCVSYTSPLSQFTVPDGLASSLQVEDTHLHASCSTNPAQPVFLAPSPPPTPRMLYAALYPQMLLPLTLQRDLSRVYSGWVPQQLKVACQAKTFHRIQVGVPVQGQAGPWQAPCPWRVGDLLCWNCL